MGAREEFMAVHRAAKHLEKQTDLDDLDAHILEFLNRVCLPERRFIRLGVEGQYIVGSLAYTVLGQKRPAKDVVPEYEQYRGGTQCVISPKAP